MKKAASIAIEAFPSQTDAKDGEEPVRFAPSDLGYPKRYGMGQFEEKLPRLGSWGGIALVA